MFTVCKSCVFTVSLAFPHWGSPVEPLELRLSSPGSLWNLLHDWDRPREFPVQSNEYYEAGLTEFIYSVTFARRHSDQKFSGVRHGLPHIFNMSLYTHLTISRLCL